MEGSLASIFVEGSLPCLPISWATSGESIEELQQRLLCTSMELESAHEAVKVQGKLNDSKLWQLQGLLETTRKERDAARHECGKLKTCLLHFSSSPQATGTAVAESPFSLLQASISSTFSSAQVNHNSSASPNIGALDFEDVNQKAYADDHLLIFEHDVDHKPFSHQAQDMYAIFSLELNQEPSSITMEDSQQQFSMGILNEEMGLDEDQSLDLTDLQLEQPLQSAWEANQSSNLSWEANLSSSSSLGCTLTRQSSCISSAASRCWGAIESPKVPAVVSRQTVAMPSHQTLSMPSHHTLAVATSETSAMPNKAFQPHLAPMQSSPTHLAEPSESDLKAMLGTLPEKGKFLQAVMQAGPLLQTLLLAGPLPQWRHPPPQLNTIGIPKVPMSPNSVPWPMVTHHHNQLPTTMPNVMQSSLMSHNMSSGLANAANLANFRGGFAGPSVPSIVSMMNSATNPCSRSRKLRKLSRILVK